MLEDHIHLIRIFDQDMVCLMEDHRRWVIPHLDLHQRATSLEVEKWVAVHWPMSNFGFSSRMHLYKKVLSLQVLDRRRNRCLQATDLGQMVMEVMGQCDVVHYLIIQDPVNAVQILASIQCLDSSHHQAMYMIT